jgi:hypothetical protein
MRFVDYPPKPWTVILDKASDLATTFVSGLLQYEGRLRMTAAEV